MKRIIAAAALAAFMAAGSIANAAVVVFQTNAVPSAQNKVQTADIAVNQFVTATEILLPADTGEFTFTALERLNVSSISLAGTGIGAANLGAVRFGFTDSKTSSFGVNGTVTSFPGGSSSATAFLPGGTMDAGDVFTIFWSGGLTSPVGVTASFFTTPVPVPAALPLLVGGLAALALVRRKA